MRHLSTSIEATGLLRRSVWVVVVAGSAVLLSGCAIWPKSWNFWSDDAEQTEPAPATPSTPSPALAAQAAPAPAAPAVAPEAQTSAVVTPVVPNTEIASPPMPEQVNTAPTATPAPADKPSAGAAAMQPTKAAVLVPGYYINVGLFAVPANGTKAYSKLEAAGLPVFSDHVKKKDVTVTRVRVGPFTTQAKATATAKKIRSLQLDAVIFKH